MKRKRAAEPPLCSRVLVPIEIQAEILSRLPVKSLLRFKCVQKSWRNLIEDPTFVRVHMILFGKTTNGFLLCDLSLNQYYLQQHQGYKRINTVMSGSQEILLSSSKWLLGETHRYIIGSSHGLVCFLYRQEDCLNVHVWNPSTRKIMELPTDFVCEDQFRHPMPLVYGFGFCPKLKDYKVVISSYPRHGLIEVQVYSLNTNSWKKIAIENSRLDVWLEFQRSKFFNGASYWLGEQINSMRRRMILAFKFEEEAFVEINLPNNNKFEDEMLDLYIAKYQNLLSLITHRRVENVVDVWVRKEEGVADHYSWVKQFSVEIPIPKCKLKTIDFEKNGELLLALNRKGRLVWYDTKTNHTEKVQELGDKVRQLFSCEQSLISLPGEISEFEFFQH